MLNLKINSYSFVLDEDIQPQKIIEEVLKHPKFLQLTRTRHQDLMYMKNGKIIQYKQLIEEGFNNLDEVSILMFVSGG